MRILFLGGTRFIGHHAAARAVAAGHDVWVAHRGNHPCEVAGVVRMRVDRTLPSDVSDAVEAARPDAVVDTRAMTAEDAEACLEGLASARFAGTVVVLSSQDVYAQFGALNGLPCPHLEDVVTEDSPLTVPVPFRGIAAHDGGDDYDKKDVEAAFLAAAPERTVVLRLPAVTGPRDPARRFGAFVDALRSGRPVPRRGGTFRWTHADVRDVAHAVVHGIELGAPGIFNVGEADTPTMAARVERLAAHLGVPLVWEDVEEVPPELGLLGPMPNDFVASSDRLRATGWAEVTTAEQRLDGILAP